MNQIQDNLLIKESSLWPLKYRPIRKKGVWQRLFKISLAGHDASEFLDEDEIKRLRAIRARV